MKKAIRSEPFRILHKRVLHPCWKEQPESMPTGVAHKGHRGAHREGQELPS